MESWEKSEVQKKNIRKEEYKEVIALLKMDIQSVTLLNFAK